MLAKEFHPEEVDPMGYWMSEKMDGVRAFWDGRRMYSKQGNEWWTPKFFTSGLPTTPLDGELW
jgi:DNA ligase-1